MWKKWWKENTHFNICFYMLDHVKIMYLFRPKITIYLIRNTFERSSSFCLINKYQCSLMYAFKRFSISYLNLNSFKIFQNTMLDIVNWYVFSIIYFKDIHEMKLFKSSVPFKIKNI